MHTTQKLTYPIVLTLILALSGGCGGGGGGTRPAPAPDTPNPPADTSDPPANPAPDPPADPTPDTSDMQVETLAEGYRNDPNFGSQWGLRTINADRAYAHVEIAGDAAPGSGITIAAPGSGVTIGFIDTGIDEDHPLFEGKTITEVILPNAADETGITRFSHGTAVASVAAAALRPLLRPRTAPGVAWGADIAMFAIPLGSGGGNYNPISGGTLRSGAPSTADIFSRALGWRDGERAVDFLNLSFGVNGIIDAYSEQQLRTNLSGLITTLAQAGATDKTILIWAAGNAHGDPCMAPPGTSWCVNGRVNASSVEVYPGLAARIDELRGHTLAVVAVKEGGEIADFSNRCGIAADYCLAAPGEEILAAYFGPSPPDPNCTANCSSRVVRGTISRSGTSFAAPMVSGALAVMKQLFRNQLSNTQLAARLLQTADKSGAYADQAIYGQGLLDLGAATAPVGSTTVTLGNRVEQAGADLRTTRIQLGTAFGDALQQSFAGSQIVAFDTLGAPFWFELEHTAQVAPAPSIATRLQHLLRPATTPTRQRFDLMQNMLKGRYTGHLTLAAHSPGLNLAESDTVSVTAFTTQGMTGRLPATGAALTWRPVTPLSLRAGWLGERQSLLGSAADGAFGTLGSDAVFLGIRTHTELGHWSIGADAEIGTVKPSARSGIITNTTDLITSAFALTADRTLTDGATLHLSLSQPLRVETGRASLTIPTGRTKTGSVIRKPITTGLTPSGRQLDLTAEWRRPLPIGELRLGAVLSHDPGHRATADSELTLLTGYRLSY